MIDSIQILLFTVVIILTLIAVIVGWQLFKILAEINKLLVKINSMADGAASISGNLSKSFKDLSGFSEGLKTVLNFLKLFKKGAKKNEPGE